MENTVPTRLVRIAHERCMETSAWTYALAPAEWTDEEVLAAAKRAQGAYLAGLAQFYKDDPPPPSGYRTLDYYQRYPNKTVAEIERNLEAKKKVYEEWEERQRQAKRSYADFLAEQGFVSMWAPGIVPEFRIDWGHRHGVGIDYGKTLVDSLPTPRKLADPEAEDEDDYWNLGGIPDTVA